MKSTKTLLIAIMAAGTLLAGSSALQAQSTNNPPSADEHGKGMRGRPNLDKQLDLTDDQKPKVEAIRKSAAEKARALREDNTLSQEEKAAKTKAIREETATQMKAVLTPEQFTKWQELTKRGPHVHQPGNEHTPNPPSTPQS